MQKYVNRRTSFGIDIHFVLLPELILSVDIVCVFLKIHFDIIVARTEDNALLWQGYWNGSLYLNKYLNIFL